jgi:hypothetical protein
MVNSGQTSAFLRESLAKYLREPTAQNMMDLFYNVRSATSFGIGVSWFEIEDIVKEEIENANRKDSNSQGD